MDLRFNSCWVSGHFVANGGGMASKGLRSSFPVNRDE